MLTGDRLFHAAGFFGHAEHGEPPRHQLVRQSPETEQLPSALRSFPHVKCDAECDILTVLGCRQGDTVHGCRVIHFLFTGFIWGICRVLSPTHIVKVPYLL